MKDIVDRLEKPPLYDQVYQQILKGILHGQFEPGQRLVETQLAQAFNISRTPVREALRQLERDNLVSADPNSGVRIQEVTLEEVEHLYECRLALESTAVRKVAAAARPRTIAAIEGALQLSEAAVKMGKADELDVLNKTKSFHREIISAAANPVLDRLWERIMHQIILFRAAVIAADASSPSVYEEHVEIFSAIKAENPEEAVEALEYHFLMDKRRGFNVLDD